MSSKKSKRELRAGNKLELSANTTSTSRHYESDIIRKMHESNHRPLDTDSALDILKDKSVTFFDREEVPDKNDSKSGIMQWLKGKSLKRKLEEAHEEASNVHNKWIKVRVEEQLVGGGSIIKRTTHENNYARKMRRVIESEIRLTSTGEISERVVKRPHEVGLAKAEQIETKLGVAQDKHHKTLKSAVDSAIEKYEKACDNIVSSLSPAEKEAEKVSLYNTYQKVVQEARKKYDKAITDLDVPYSEQLLTALQQIQGKENNEADIESRKKSVESKLDQHPEKLNANTEAIQKQLTKIEGLVQGLGTAMDPIQGSADQRSSTDIVDNLKSNLSRTRTSLSDYTKDLTELIKRCPVSAEGNELYLETINTMNLLTERRIITHEQTILIFKRERYMRGQDSEGMGYNYDLQDLYGQMGEIKQELAMAEGLHGQFVRESDRIYKELRTSRDKDARPVTGGTLYPDTSDDGSALLAAEINKKIDELHEMQRDRDAGNIIDPATHTKIQAFKLRHARMQKKADSGSTSTEDARQYETEEDAEHAAAEEKERYKEVQDLVDRTLFNLLSVRAEAAKLDHIERSIQREIDLANGRYDTNETREGRFRDRIVDTDKEDIESKHRGYEQIFIHQKQVAAMRVQVLLVQFSAREAMKFALYAMLLSLPNAMQRETSSVSNSAQRFIMGL